MGADDDLPRKETGKIITALLVAIIDNTEKHVRHQSGPNVSVYSITSYMHRIDFIYFRCELSVSAASQTAKNKVTKHKTQN